MSERRVRGGAWEARSELISSFCFNAESQADLFLDISMFLYGNEEAIVLSGLIRILSCTQRMCVLV